MRRLITSVLRFEALSSNLTEWICKEMQKIKPNQSLVCCWYPINGKWMMQKFYDAIFDLKRDSEWLTKKKN